MPYISQITIQTFDQPMKEKSSEPKKEDENVTSAEKDIEEICSLPKGYLNPTPQEKPVVISFSPRSEQK